MVAESPEQWVAQESSGGGVFVHVVLHFSSHIDLIIQLVRAPESCESFFAGSDVPVTKLSVVPSKDTVSFLQRLPVDVGHEFPSGVEVLFEVKVLGVGQLVFL